MTDYPSPKHVAHKLVETAINAENPVLRQDLREGAETINYLLTLLNECADYIESVKEYEKPPRFILAVREALVDK
ncbi:MAG: hypothetical protein J0M11_05425 [Anaerolineae bacterium]|jgi:hypothetical protein|nr:hypothetical protein [Anaerolineae bacterium]